MKSIRYAITALLLLVLACGDSGTGPGSGGPEFPSIDAGTLSSNCIRGTAVPPAIRAGNLSQTDCPTLNTIVGVTDGFWEGWRVRVSEAGPVTFSVRSDLDTTLDLFEIDPANPALTLANLLGFDDDSGENFNAELTFTLEPETEYWILVAGFEAADVGSFTLDIS